MSPLVPASASDRVLSRASLALTVPVVAAPFLSFAHGYSALDAVMELVHRLPGADVAAWQVFGLGAPLFLGWLIIGLRFRRAWFDRLGPAAVIMAWTLAALATANDGLLVVGMILESGNDWLFALLPLGAWAASAMLLHRRWHHLVATKQAPLVALEIAFTAHAPLLLATFHTETGPGWWLTLLAQAGIGLHLLALAKYRRALPAHASLLSTP